MINNLYSIQPCPIHHPAIAEKLMTLYHINLFAPYLIILCSRLYNKMSMTFRQRFTFEDRTKKAKGFLESDPDKIMVIVERHPRSKLPDLANNKFLTFRNFKYGQVKALVEKRIKEKLTKEGGIQSYYLFVGGCVPGVEETMQVIYDRYKDKDGILYIVYQEQQAF